MSARRFDNFQDRLAGDAGAADPEKSPATAEDTAPEKPGPVPGPDDDSEPEEEIEMPNDTPLEEREDFKAGVAAGEKKATDRMNTVFAHDNTKGREASAIKLLGKASMSAEDIVDVLADMPQVQQASQEEANKAAEEAARSEMRDEMNKHGNVDLGADQNSEPKGAKAKADGVWDKANAAVGRTKKEA